MPTNKKIIRKPFSFHVDKDKDVLDKLREQSNASAYIRELIRKDIEGSSLIKEVKQLLYTSSINNISNQDAESINEHTDNTDLIMCILNDLGNDI